MNTNANAIGPLSKVISTADVLRIFRNRIWMVFCLKGLMFLLGRIGQVRKRSIWRGVRGWVDSILLRSAKGY